jgi:hypothetical protein
MINYQHYNYPAGPGKCGGAICLCDKCRQERQQRIDAYHNKYNKLREERRLLYKQSSDTIYTITLVSKYNASCHEYCDECIGFYHDCDNAVKAVLYDSMLWDDPSYEYVVIEEVKPGTYPHVMNQLWIDRDLNVIDTPEEHKDVCNFGIG